MPRRVERKEHYRAPVAGRGICGGDLKRHGILARDPPQDRGGILENDCGRCVKTLQRSWENAQNPLEARHYRRAGNDGAGGLVCGNPGTNLMVEPVDIPTGENRIQEADCQACVRTVTSMLAPRRATRGSVPLEHIQKREDPTENLCGRQGAGQGTRTVPYPDELPPEEPHHCRVCRRHWNRRERRTPRGSVWG